VKKKRRVLLAEDHATVRDGLKLIVNAQPDMETLTARIRAEYTEMPGLRLTLAQACRLWQVDRTTCESVLERLVAERLLVQTRDGAYIALPGASRAIKAVLAGPPLPRRQIA